MIDLTHLHPIFLEKCTDPEKVALLCAISVRRVDKFIRGPAHIAAGLPPSATNLDKCFADTKAMALMTIDPELLKALNGVVMAAKIIDFLVEDLREPTRLVVSRYRVINPYSRCRIYFLGIGIDDSLASTNPDERLRLVTQNFLNPVLQQTGYFAPLKKANITPNTQQNDPLQATGSQLKQRPF